MPTRVGAADSWTSVATGSSMACGIAAGELFCWAPRQAPQRVGESSDWEQLTVGGAHACAIRAGELYCWGANETGALGTGPDSVGTTTAARLESERRRLESVSAGLNSSCGIRNGGCLCWGTAVHRL